MDLSSMKIKMSIKTFTINEVHLHYTCHCPVQPIMKLNRDTQMIEITVNLKCPKCHKGKSEELIIGNMSIATTKCPHPGCDCDRISTTMPLAQFMGILQSPAS